MRLKRLILHGFKSFADRTEFVFDAPITGIVGPNGCGKSNVVDGFKWVLGEQSAKSLRGEAMLDVIFNGSGSRKPGGMSEVVLVFENPKRADGSRTLNLDLEEVSVGRRLFRDGTSEYQINNQSSRLRDVRELFFDTGVGVDAYSVIEQGKVDLLLQSNPQERRLIFEEAAGISKYKAKKKEAQRKLERVDQNLLRVRDIVEEVEKRLRSVKIQAGRARTFQEHSLRLRELRLTYALQEYHALHGQHAGLETALLESTQRLEESGARLSEKQQVLGEKRQQFEEQSQVRQRAEYELVQTTAAIQSARQQQQYATQQLQQVGEQLAQLDQDREAARQKGEQTAAALDQESAALERLTAELSEHRKQIEQQQQAFHDGQLQLNRVSREIEQHKAAILDLMRQASNVNNRLGAIEIEHKNIGNQQSRLSERRQTVVGEAETLDAAGRDIQVEMDRVVAEMAELQGQLQASSAEAAALGKQIAQFSEQLSAAREHRSGLVSRQKLLQDLEARREGVSEGVKSVLRQRNERFPFIRGLVADILRVDVEHAPVIEAALDGKDQFLVTDTHAAAWSAQPLLEDLEGRVNILSTDRLAGFSDGYDWNRHPQLVRRAVDLVKFQPADEGLAQHLLGRTIVTDDLRDASELAQAGPAGYRYVTHAGEVLEADGTLRAGPLTAAMGLLSRRSELEAIAQQLVEVDARVQQLSAHVSDGNAHAKALQEEQNELRNANYQCNTRKVQLGSRMAQTQDKQNALRRELPLLDRELANLLDQVNRLKSEETTLQEKRQGIEANQASRQQQIEQMTGQLAELNESLRTAGEHLTSLRVLLGQVQEKQLASQQAVRRLDGLRVELNQQAERIAKSIEQFAERRVRVEGELKGAVETEAQHVGRQQSLTEGRGPAAAAGQCTSGSDGDAGRRGDEHRGRAWRGRAGRASAAASGWRIACAAGRAGAANDGRTPA